MAAAMRAVLALAALTTMAAALSDKASVNGDAPYTTNINVVRPLAGAALGEFNKLNNAAKRKAEEILRHAFISPDDANDVHFDAKGNLFIADPSPKYKPGLDWLAEESAEEGERRRRAISDAQPDRILASGKRFAALRASTALFRRGGPPLLDRLSS